MYREVFQHLLICLLLSEQHLAMSRRVHFWYLKSAYFLETQWGPPLYSRVDNVVKSQMAFYGIQEANGFELLRLLRREFSLMSRPEALQYREACLKYTVKKSERHLLMDVLREIGAEIEGFHSMLEASLIAGQLADLCIFEGDQYLLYLRNLPEKVAEYVQLHCGATTVARVWESVVAYHTRMRLTNEVSNDSLGKEYRLVSRIATWPCMSSCRHRGTFIIHKNSVSYFNGS